MKACIACDASNKDAFSPRQWKKKPMLARMCESCMDLDLEPIDDLLEENFDFSVAKRYGWTYLGCKGKRGETTLRVGAGLSWERNFEGHVQQLCYWPSTGTTESILLHPKAVQPRALYRSAVSSDAKEQLQLLFENPRRHTSVGYYFTEDKRYNGMDYEEAQETLFVKKPRSSRSSSRKRGRGERKPRALSYYLENKLDEECNLHKIGRCYYGMHCRRVHVGHVTPEFRTPVDEVCRNFSRGACRFGDLCHRVHEM